MTLKQLRKKDVIRADSGDNLGRIDDLEFEEGTALIAAVILYGRTKFFGLGGKQPDLRIAWSNILQIGNDVVLVRMEDQEEWVRPKGLFQRLGF